MPSQIDPRDLGSPIVPSQTAASSQFEQWLKESRKETLLDSEGQAWEIAHKIDLNEGEGPRWVISLWLELSTNLEELVARNVFDSIKDKRLIELIGSNVPAMKLRPREFAVGSMENALLVIKTEVLNMEEALKAVDTARVKRKIVTDWLDKSLVFGQL